MRTTTESLSTSSWRDYLELCKPRVVALMLLTSLVGMLLASHEPISWQILLFGNLGIGLLAGAGAAINHIVDRKIDSIMARTRHRPLVMGKVDTVQALAFAFVLAVAGLVVLIWQVNVLTAWLTLVSLLGYAVVYTVFLKRLTPQNIVIGGLAGAMPPLLGWTAVTGQIDPHALLLVLIIFAWTPPHFWALAIHRREEYALADIPMLPVTHGVAYTKLHVLLYTLILFAVSLLPFITEMSGLIYLIGALLLGCRFLYWAFALMFDRRRHAPIKTFKYSITYLMLLFVVLLADHHYRTLGIG